jgi:hypothetical protein
MTCYGPYGQTRKEGKKIYILNKGTRPTVEKEEQKRRRKIKASCYGATAASKKETRDTKIK